MLLAVTEGNLQVLERVPIFCQIRQSGLQISSPWADRGCQSLKPTLFDCTFCSSRKAHLSLWFVKLRQDKVEAAHDQVAGEEARKK